MSATCSLGPIACREKHPQCSRAAVVLVLGDLRKVLTENVMLKGRLCEVNRSGSSLLKWGIGLGNVDRIE